MEASGNLTVHAAMQAGMSLLLPATDDADPSQPMAAAASEKDKKTRRSMLSYLVAEWNSDGSVEWATIGRRENAVRLTVEPIPSGGWDWLVWIASREEGCIYGRAASHEAALHAADTVGVEVGISLARSAHRSVNRPAAGPRV